MKVLLALIPIAALPVFYAVTAAQTPASATPRVGFLSPQRIFAESARGKADMTKLQTLQQQKQTELRGKQQILEATRQRIAQNTDAGSRDRLQQEETQQRADLERAAAQAQNEIQTLQRQIQTDLQNAVKPIVEEIAKKENVQVVLNDQYLVWAAPTLDMTQAVIERMNAKP